MNQNDNSENNTPANAKPKKKRGFAVMNREKVQLIAQKGGKAAHAAGTAHEFSREEAQAAGRKGGYATHANRRSKTTAVAPTAPEGNGASTSDSESTSESVEPEAVAV